MRKKIDRAFSETQPDTTRVDLHPFALEGTNIAIQGEEIPIIDISELVKIPDKIVATNDNKETEPTLNRYEQYAKEVIDYIKSSKLTGDRIPQSVKKILFENPETISENPDSILGYIIADFAKNGDVETAKQLSELGSNKVAQEQNKSDLISYLLEMNILDNRTDFNQLLNSITTESIRKAIVKGNADKISALKNNQKLAA